MTATLIENETTLNTIDAPDLDENVATSNAPIAEPTASELIEDEDDEEEFIGRGARKARHWHSGWCGPDGCRDGGFQMKSGEPIFNCRGFCENGERATNRYVFCACTCHEDPARGDLGSIQRADMPSQEVRQSPAQKAATKK